MWKRIDNNKVVRNKRYEGNRITGLSEENYDVIQDRKVLVYQSGGCFPKLMFHQVSQDDVCCEIMATYNALVLQKIDIDYFKLCTEFELNATAYPIITSLLFHKGMWGSNPYRIGDCLACYGCRTDIVKTTDSLDKKIKQAGWAIISYRFGYLHIRIHTFVVVYDQETDTFSSINQLSNAQHVIHNIASAEAILIDRKIMVAFLPIGE